MQALIRQPASGCSHHCSPSFTGTRRPLSPADANAHFGPRTPCSRPQAGRGVECRSSKAVSGLLGAAVGLSLLLPGAGAAAAVDTVAVAGPAEATVVVEQQLLPPLAPSTYQLSAELSAAPELLTDLEVEVSGGFDMEAALATGLGWMMEEGLEVTNFSESNFAAVGAPSSSMWLSNSPWCLVWDAYCNVLTRQPVATKLATGMVGTFLGDMLAQATQGLLTSTAAASAAKGRRGAAAAAAGGFALDLGRTARLVGFSALVGTPVAFVWFGLLDQVVLPADPTSPLAVFAKVAADQVLMAPAMTSLFFAAMAWLEGCRDGRQVAATVAAKLRPTLLANWTVWPLAHVINFALVPPVQRILYINVVNIAWTAFMSHMASNSDDSATDAVSPAPQQQRRQAKPQLQQARR